MPSTRLRVPTSRDSRMRRSVSAFQRWAMSSPARWITASRPLSAAVGAGPCMGSHCTPLPALRLRIVTSSPRSRSALVIIVPRRPVAPVIVTLMRGVRRAAGSGSLPDRPELLRVAGRVAARTGVGEGRSLALGLLGDGVGDRLRHVAVERRGDDVILAQLVVAHDGGDAAG